MSELVIRACDVQVHLGNRTVLDGVSFEVRRGEVLALLGPSGGGKTTLLRTLNYLTPLDGGEIEVLGVRLHPGMSERRHAPVLQALRRRVGMVFQHFHLFPHRTVLENVIEAPRHVLKWPLAEAVARAEEWLSRLEVAHLRDRLPRFLSGGEQQRVSLARALVLEPEILLLDEPTSALDPQRQELVSGIIAAMTARGGSVVVATHQTDFARRVAQRGVLLRGGRIIAQGALEGLVRSGSIEDAAGANGGGALAERAEGS